MGTTKKMLPHLHSSKTVASISQARMFPRFVHETLLVIRIDSHLVFVSHQALLSLSLSLFPPAETAVQHQSFGGFLQCQRARIAEDSELGHGI